MDIYRASKPRSLEEVIRSVNVHLFTDTQVNSFKTILMSATSARWNFFDGRNDREQTAESLCLFQIKFFDS